jgi:hypothetical protein
MAAHATYASAAAAEAVKRLNGHDLAGCSSGSSSTAVKCE